MICNPETGDLVGVLDFTLAWIGNPLWDFPEVYRCGADILEHTVAIYTEMSGRKINTEAVKIISRDDFDRFGINFAATHFCVNSHGVFENICAAAIYFREIPEWVADPGQCKIKNANQIARLRIADQVLSIKVKVP